jgi:hypothetical protein
VRSVLDSRMAGAPKRPACVRMSTVLRGILSENPWVKTFTVEEIVSAIGDEGFEASLMLFSLPAVVPVPTSTGFAALSAGEIACEMAAGRQRIRLPRIVRKRTISRRALAVAIHAILPALEAAENIVRPRWTWVNHAIWRRMIGLFVLVLVLAIAFPLFGFNFFHATSIFVISLGMAERDGLAVMLGLVVGMLSLATVASGLSLRALRSSFVAWIWKLSRKLGLELAAKLLDRLGRTRLARVIRFRWWKLLLRWDPEKRAAGRRPNTTTRRPAVLVGVPQAMVA